jgi:hypothetical protein
MEAQTVHKKKTGGWETPGSFVIMTIYLGWFFVMWLLTFVYLAAQWAIS